MWVSVYSYVHCHKHACVCTNCTLIWTHLNTHVNSGEHLHITQFHPYKHSYTLVSRGMCRDTCKHMNTYMFSHFYTLMVTCTQTNANVQTYRHTYLYICQNKFMQTCKHANAHMQIYIHTYMHTTHAAIHNLHIHINTCKYTNLCKLKHANIQINIHMQT